MASNLNLNTIFRLDTFHSKGILMDYKEQVS